MRLPLFLYALFFTVQSISAQTAKELNEDFILIAADSIVNSNFSGIIAVNTLDGNTEFFVGGMANRELEQPVDENQLFNLLSLGKSLTAAVIVKLAQEGKLELSDTIGKYLPDREIPNQDKITIKQLLSHTSGLGDYMNTEDFYALPGSKVNIESLLSIIEKQPVQKEPGESFVYSNSGYIVLGALIEAVEGDRYKDILREKILGPVGIKRNGFSIEDKYVKYYLAESSEPVNDKFPPASSDGGIWMSANDLSKFLSFLFSDQFTEESRSLLFNRIFQFPDRGERKNGGLASSFLVYEYPGEVKVIGNNGGYKGSTYSAFRILYNQKGETVMATVLSNQKDTAGPAMRALEEEIKNVLQ